MNGIQDLKGGQRNEEKLKLAGGVGVGVFLPILLVQKVWGEGQTHSLQQFCTSCYTSCCTSADVFSAYPFLNKTLHFLEDGHILFQVGFNYCSFGQGHVGHKLWEIYPVDIQHAPVAILL